jgi:hypothetical protein
MHSNKLHVQMPYEEITLGAVGKDRRNGESKTRSRGNVNSGEGSSNMDDVPLMMGEGFDYDDDDYLSEGYGSTAEDSGTARNRRKRKGKKGFVSNCWWFCCGGWKTCCGR